MLMSWKRTRGGQAGRRGGCAGLENSGGKRLGTKGLRQDVMARRRAKKEVTWRGGAFRENATVVEVPRYHASCTDRGRRDLAGVDYITEKHSNRDPVACGFQTQFKLQTGHHSPLRRHGARKSFFSKES